MRTLATIILTAIIVWFVSTQLGIEWPRVSITFPEGQGQSSQAPSQTQEASRQIVPLPFPQEALENQVLELINQLRASEGLRELQPSDHLREKAREHSQYMADTGKFEHSDYKVAENIYWGIGISINRLPQSIMTSWTRSKGHRENLLRPEITKCGIGIARNEETNSVFATFMAY